MFEQLCWLAAVLQEKQSSLHYAQVHVAQNSSGFNIKAELTELPSPGKGAAASAASCWRSLVSSHVLAAGFPCPPRDESAVNSPLRRQWGLEVSIPLMLALARIPQAVNFREGCVFKGRYHALVPTEVSDGYAQWHMLDTYPKRLTWGDLEKAVPFMAVMTFERLQSLWNARSFLGWCPEVVEYLGN